MTNNQGTMKVTLKFTPTKPASFIVVTTSLTPHCRGCDVVCKEIEIVHCDTVCGRLVFWAERGMQ